MQQSYRRCLFLDRDGVVNSSPGLGYITNIDQFSLNDGIGDLLKTAHALGWLAIIVSSQRCVAKGLIDSKDLASIHGSMQDLLMDRYRSKFDAIYVQNDVFIRFLSVKAVKNNFKLHF